ncbi:MAG: hypothetical protein HRU20_14625 [Pseudomonadales bacterium]|nr:hypothetical protein [Pseudomonadales bacterium]
MTDELEVKNYFTELKSDCGRITKQGLDNTTALRNHGIVNQQGQIERTRLRNLAKEGNDAIHSTISSLYETSKLAQQTAARLDALISSEEDAWRLATKKRNAMLAIDHAKAIENRESERHDMWKLWAHKIVRWGVGTCSAVFLYSALVWLQNEWAFIKIPLKDWIPKQQQL